MMIINQITESHVNNDDNPQTAGSIRDLLGGASTLQSLVETMTSQLPYALRDVVAAVAQEPKEVRRGRMRGTQAQFLRRLQRLMFTFSRESFIFLKVLIILKPKFSRVILYQENIRGYRKI